MNNKKSCGCFRSGAGLVYNGKIHILQSELSPHYLQTLQKIDLRIDIFVLELIYSWVSLQHHAVNLTGAQPQMY
jgi:hypothetical protein